MKLNMIGSRGHWGYVFDSIKDVSDVEITAVSSGGEDDMSRVLSSCKEFGFTPKVYENYLEMLDTEKPDIVCVDAQFDKHAEFSVACLKRNIHVFCEKPIALTMKDLRRVEMAYKNSQAKIFSMIGLRYDAAFQTALNLVRGGVIGKVKLISTRKSYKLGVRPEHFKHRQTYGGTIPWVGSHAIDWIMAFADCFKVKKVFAFDTTEDNFNNGDLEIAAQCQFLMENNVIAQATIDYLRPATASTHGDDQVRVAGTAGVIEVRNSQVFLINQNGEQQIPTCAERKLFSDIVLDCQNKRQAITSPEETIALTEACLMAQANADIA